MPPKRSRAALATALTALAGYVDAIGFLQLAGTFLSFMSGNTTRFGVGLAGSGTQAGLAAAVILLFVAGVVGGHSVRRAVGGRRPSAVLAVMAVLLAAAGALADAGWLMAAVGSATFAMGMANTVFEKDGQVGVGVTYVTGTLVRLGDGVAAALAGGPRLGWTGPLWVWTSLAAGSVVGGLAFRVEGLDAVWAAAALAALLAGSALVWPPDE